MFSRKSDEDQNMESQDYDVEDSVESVNSDEVEQSSSPVRHLKPSMISEGFEFNGDIKSNGSLTVAVYQWVCLMPLVCTCLGCGSTSVFCARDGCVEGGSLRGALQPCIHVARGTEGVAARRKAEELG